MNKIYFDHAATAPVDKQVLKAMLPYFSKDFGNASSLHKFGQVANSAVEESRKSIADFLNCQADEIIFTSGATEANNLAILGLVNWTEKLHIITSAIEHPAVFEVCKHLEKIGHAEVSYIKPHSNGVVRVEDIKKEIKDNTKLISVMYANNEIGTLQPIQEIGEIIKKENKKRMGASSAGSLGSAPLRSGQSSKILFHTDAVQATNYLEMDVQKLGVDLLSLSGHKVYGPKGVGVLYIKKNTPLRPVYFGGHHEQGIRPGTINTPLIVGLGKAIDLIKTRDNSSIKNLRDYAWQKIKQEIPQVKINGDLDKRLPNNLNISLAGVEGEALLLELDLQGIAISTGSACSSGSLEASHVLMALGLSHEDAHGSLRISLGKNNTHKEINIFVKKLKIAVEKYRHMAPK